MTSNRECSRRAREYNIIEPPINTKLPFFAYGFYKPHQLAYPLIKDFVEGKPRQSKVKGTLKQVNGIPVLLEQGHKRYVEGYLIYFKKGFEERAYKKVGYSRNKGIYEWKEMKIDGKNANVLISSKPETFKSKGNWNYEFNKRKYIKELNIYLESYDWRKDPIFEKPIDYIFLAKNLKKSSKNISEPIFDESKDSINPSNDNKKLKRTLNYEYIEFFETQMLYMLLWTSIDRFLTFRYGETKKNNVISLSEEESFRIALKKYVNKDDEVFHNRKTVYSVRDLREYELNPSKPACSAMFYYTIRNNVVHSGKVLMVEQKMLFKALKQLSKIFNAVIESAKKE